MSTRPAQSALTTPTGPRPTRVERKVGFVVRGLPVDDEGAQPWRPAGRHPCDGDVLSRDAPPPPAQTRRPAMTTLAELSATLGPGVLTLLTAPGGSDVELDGVVIHDPLDPPSLAPGTLALAVGLRPGADLRVLMERAAGDGAVVIVKCAAAALAALRDEAAGFGVAVVAVPPGAAWLQIASLLRSALVPDAGARHAESLGGVDAGDLFALANAVAAVVDAPVTIEDRQGRVIAFSARQDEADAARMATILGRRVPDDYYRALTGRGVFRTLYRSAEPIYIDGIGPDVLPRIAVAVRAGDELLGSIWAAVRERPDDRRMRDFGETASFVALHLLRHRIAADGRRELQRDLVAVLLNGRLPATDVARRLGLRGEAFRVLSVALVGEGDDDDGVLARCWDALALHLSVQYRGAVTAVVEGALYAVLPVAADGDRSRRTATAAGEGFAARLPEALLRRVVVGVGGHAAGLAGIPRSREDADRVAQVLRETADHPAPVRAIEEVRTAVLLRRLRDIDGGPDAGGPLAPLAEHDARSDTHYVESLRAWLDEMGDVNRAATRLGVHHNTLRYRLQKIRGLPGIDLDDPEQRLALQLELRLRPPISDRGAASAGPQ